MIEKIQTSEEELFQVLEKKLMDLLSERENILRDNQILSQEKEQLLQAKDRLSQEKEQLIEELTLLQNEKKDNVQKLELLISLFNATDAQEKTSAPINEITNTHINIAGAKPILVQA